MLFSILLPLHNIIRWIVLLSGLIAILFALAGWIGRKPWTKTNTILVKVFTMSFDVQILIGLVLYFISPTNQVALQNFGAAMRNTEMRFYAVEHIFGMIFALAMAHAGRTLARIAKDHWKKHRNAALFFILSLVIVIALTPWGRQLFPF